jgi:hypothetical protein
MRKQPREKTEKNGSMKKAIREDTMNWVVAVFQGE